MLFFMIRRIYWIVVILFVIAGMTLYWVWSPSTDVQKTTVQKRNVVEVYVATGQIDVTKTSDISAEVAGTVDRITVQEGDEVNRGDTIIQLRSPDARLDVKKAEARLKTLLNELKEIKRGPTDAEIREAQSKVNQYRSEFNQAKRTFERMQQLYEDEAISEQKFEQTRSSLEQVRARLEGAKAQLEQLRERPLPLEVEAARSQLEVAKVKLQRARDDFSRTVVSSPYDGLVLEIQTDKGERVTPNEIVARLAKMSTAEIYAEVDEDYFGRLQSGQPATLIFPSMPGKTFSASVKRVGPEIQTNRGVVGVHLTPQSLPENAFPGLTVDANIEVARLKQAHAAPTDAVVRDSSGDYVLVEKNGRAFRQSVDIRARGDRWMALEGIEVGTRVIRNAARIDVGEPVSSSGETEP